MKRTKAIRHFARQAAMTLLVAFLAVATTHAQDYSVWGTADGADGSEEHPYVIKTTVGLDLLASEVNGGNGFSGTHFVLGDDIEYSPDSDWDADESTEINFTSIGTGSESFRGMFDGQGHTIRGIRIYSEDNYQGLFGRNYGTVKNVILADARIAGQQLVGGIVGNNWGTIEDCHVCADVLIASVGGNPMFHGGIVGRNYRGIVNGCTSAATLSEADSSGGIVGENRGTVSHCRAVGVTISENDNVGAIAGIYASATFSHNYYYSCTCDGKTYGIGTGYDEVSNNDGTVRTETIPLFDDYSNAGLIAVCSSTDHEWDDNYTLTGRTLYKDGSWNTICLPFNVNWNSYCNYYSLEGNGLTVMALDAANSTFADGVLTLNFTTIYDGVTHTDNLVAGTPYIIKWDEDTNNPTIVNPTFEDVEISTATNPATTEYVDFIGTTSPVSLAAGDRTVLFLGSDNYLYYPSDAMTIGSFRGYFKLKNGLSMNPNAPKAVRSLVLNFGDGEASGIENVQWSMVNGQWITVNQRPGSPSTVAVSLASPPRRACTSMRDARW
ncbi:MAG: hypothetical protein J5552_00015 [Prevotella sp.]|nr:hypothetical protein [Prevotella sp.]